MNGIQLEDIAASEKSLEDWEPLGQSASRLYR
jgi:hypothetical protein